jgi:hypothetical protein
MTRDTLPPCAKEFTFIGVEDDVCPYCGVVLEKRPQRKTCCKHCGGFIYARQRPIDEFRVLLREDQLELLELEWSLDYRIKYTDMPKEQLLGIVASMERQKAERDRKRQMSMRQL